MTGHRAPGDRIRRPPPVLRHRLGSGRGATEQPNAGDDGEAALTARFWLLVVVTGIAAGLFGDLTMLVLFNVQHVAFDGHPGGFSGAVEPSSALRRVLLLLLAGAVSGPAWFVLRRYSRGRSEIDEALWNGTGELSLRRSLATSVISEVVIGLGASLGREAAPKLLGGASGSLLAGLTGLSPAQRRLLVACGGGAGLAAVYNVPLGGALFTAEILCGSITLPTILPALVCSWTATVTAWLYLPTQATYPDIPGYHVDPQLMVWAIVAGPVIGVLAAGYVRVIGWVSDHRPAGRAALVAPLGAFAVLGAIGVRYPQVFGNGQEMAHGAFLGAGSLGLLLTLSALKPLVTALCLNSGATGGLFTPVLSTGAVLGAALGLLWSSAWPGAPVGAFAMVGATAMVGAAMQAPLTALVLVLELTHSGFELLVPMMVATATATAVTRYLDGYSIYTARLPKIGPRRRRTEGPIALIS